MDMAMNLDIDADTDIGFELWLVFETVPISRINYWESWFIFNL
jgi:hypothetical protein